MTNELKHYGVLGMRWGQRLSARKERNLKKKALKERNRRHFEDLVDDVFDVARNRSRDIKSARKQSRARMKSEGVGLVSRYAKSFGSKEVKKVKGVYDKKYDALDRKAEKYDNYYSRNKQKIKDDYKRELDRIKGREVLERQRKKRK